MSLRESHDVCLVDAGLISCVPRGVQRLAARLVLEAGAELVAALVERLDVEQRRQRHLEVCNKANNLKGSIKRVNSRGLS